MRRFQSVVRTKYKSVRAKLSRNTSPPSGSLEPGTMPLEPEALSLESEALQQGLESKPESEQERMLDLLLAPSHAQPSITMSEETRLLAECSIPYYNILNNRESSVAADHEAFRDRVADLLRAGADPNLTVCAYQVGELLAHRILGTRALSDFIEGTYLDICGAAAMDSEEQALALERDSVQYMFNPFLEGVFSGDFQMVTLFMKSGVSLAKILRHLQAGPRSEYGRRNAPLELANFGLMEALFRSDENLLDLSVQHWIIARITEILHSVINMLQVPYRDLGPVTKIHQDILHYRRVRFIPVPQQVIRKGKDNVSFLPAILQAEPIAHIPVVLDDEELFNTVYTAGEHTQDADFQHVSALHIAVGNVTAKMCSRLIRLGVDVTVLDRLGISPLDEAVYYGHMTAIKLLLDVGADMHARGQSSTNKVNMYSEGYMLWGEWRGIRNKCFPLFFELGWSVLHVAIWQGFHNVVQLLVDRGAELSLKDASGRTALDLSVELERVEITGTLLSIGAPFDSSSTSASLLLTKAVMDRDDDLVKHLEACGVMPMPPDEHAMASFRGVLREYREPPSTQLALGPCPEPFNGQLWEMYRRLPLAGCPHLQESHPQLKRPVSDKSSSICKMCLLLAGHGKHLKSGYIPVGAMMRLILRHVRETQNLQLISFVSKSKLDHMLAWVSAEWHNLLECIPTLHDDNTGSPAATATSAQWLLHCTTSHRACQILDSSYVPTRLVEVLDTDTVRIVERGSSQHAYVALSHRWGQDEASKTTSSNYTQRMSAFSANQLSPTLQDAIKATQGLGFRYIWVDVLCIVQDSDADWLHEASEMCHVYSHAAITIAAECVEEQHGGQGMFRERAIHESRPFHFRQLETFVDEPLQHLIRRDEPEDQELYIFPSTGDTQRGNRAKGVLDTRGWILQEQLLSPRILYFGPQQLYWDCISQSASEISPLAASLLNDPQSSETWAFRLLRRTIAGNGDADTLARLLADIWIHVVQNYSARTLTESSDKLIALQGVISAVAGVLGISSVAGMWQQDLWKQLIWWVSSPTSPQDPQDATFSAPTWSWLSAPGAVLHHQSMRIDRSPVPRRLNDLTAVPSLRCTITGLHSSATSVIGELTLSGPTFSYHLTPNDLKEITWKRGHPAKLNLAPARWMLDRTIELPQAIECVIVAEDEVSKMTVCMCLVRDETQTERWKRVGLCLWDGLTWQIARHVGKELEENGFVVV